MPKRSAPALPTGSLSINETRSAISSLILRFEKHGDVVSQLEMEVKDNGKVELLLKGVNFDWSKPLLCADATLTITEAKTNAEEESDPNKKPKREEESLDNLLTSCEDLIADEVLEKIEKTPSKDSFQAALDALPSIDTSHPPSITTTSPAPSEVEGDVKFFKAYLASSIAGKRYKLVLRKDGGITCDMTGRLTDKPKKHVKRNVFVIKSNNALGDVLLMILSKARPKSSIPIDDLPSGVDLAIGNGKSSYGMNPTGAVLGYTNEEMEMLRTIRETVSLYYTN
jgi:hypothetical protein